TGKHNYTAEIVKDDALKSGATCEAAATYYYSCTVCGEVEKNDAHTFTSGSALGHKFEWVIDVDSTCTSTGIMYEKCVNCGETRNENTVIDRKSHKLSETKKNEPTCTTAGNIEYYTCLNCAKLFKDSACTKEVTVSEIILRATGHNYQQAERKEATCQSEGYILYVCSNDKSHSHYEKLTTINHTDENGDGKCDICDTVISIEFVDVCEYCGKVHTSFFDRIVHFFRKLFAFFKGLM
ncbi:MAG: hypothetical protein J1E34_09820, partial [Oscillospiraceae bacterium]|nr:hypothetical protein [Oscillospiraceae bacterium]